MATVTNGYHIGQAQFESYILDSGVYIYAQSVSDMQHYLDFLTWRGKRILTVSSILRFMTRLQCLSTSLERYKQPHKGAKEKNGRSQTMLGWHPQARARGLSNIKGQKERESSWRRVPQAPLPVRWWGLLFPNRNYKTSRKAHRIIIKG